MDKPTNQRLRNKGSENRSTATANGRLEIKRLRWQFIERTPQRFIRQTVGRGYIRRCDFNIGSAPGGLDRTLILVQQGYRVDQGKILDMVPPGPRAIIQGRQWLAKGIDHLQWPKQPLGVAVAISQIPSQATAVDLPPRVRNSAAIFSTWSVGKQKRRGIGVGVFPARNSTNLPSSTASSATATR